MVGVALTLATVTACSQQGPGSSDDGSQGQTSTAAQADKKSEARIISSIKPGAKGVDLERKVKLWVRAGTFEEVQVTGPRGGIVEGKLTKGKTRWISRTPLQAASRYRVPARPWTPTA